MTPIDYDLDRHVPREEEDALGMVETIDYAERLNRLNPLIAKPGQTVDLGDLTVP